FETPGIHTDRKIVSKEIVASEIKVDHAGNGVVQEQDIVGKEIRVNDAVGKVLGPFLRQGFKRVGKARRHAGRDLVRDAANGGKELGPARKGKRVFSVEGEGQTTLMKSSERRADSAAMGRLRLLQGISGEEGDDGSGLARKRLKDAPRSVVNGCGAHDAALSEMLHEAEKEGE